MWQCIHQELMKEAESRCKAWGVKKLFLGVESDNESALNMYMLLGYNIFVDPLKHGSECVHLLQKILYAYGV
jgi:ribosomal protein S18 acetylase RimI-like enzyme